MGLTRGKIIIAAIFVGIAIALASLVGFTNLQQKEISPKISVSLENVKMKSIDRNDPTLMIVQVDFSVLNETAQTLVIAKIDYDLYANESLIGRGNVSLEDTPLTGRAPLFSGSPTTIPSEMKIRKSTETMEVWDKLTSGMTEGIKWRTEGAAQIESAFSIIDVNFNSTL